MTPLAPHLTAFFQERLTLELQASINIRVTPMLMLSSCC